jgi:Macrocin-O-methyltransferase (TylF)
MPRLADEKSSMMTSLHQSVILSKESPSSCPHLEFEPRTAEDEGIFLDAYKRATHFVLDERLTFLTRDALEFHRTKLHEIESKAIPGTIIECGVAKAGSSIIFAAYKNPRRCLHLFDTFDGIPEPSSKDGDDVMERYRIIQKGKEACQKGRLLACDKRYYGNMENLLEYDIAQFEKARLPPQDNAVFFHKGLFDDTVWPGGPIAYAHLVRCYLAFASCMLHFTDLPRPSFTQDGDWYDSTYNMLERLSPYLSSGGYFILDDVYSWSGAKNAFQDFFHVDLKILQLQTDKTCQATVTTTVNGKSNTRYYLVAMEIRAMAQALDSRSESIIDCKPLSE